MALVTRRLANLSNGTAYVDIDFQDNNELVEAVRWANNYPDRDVLCRVVREDTGAEVMSTRLGPNTSGSMAFSGGDRFKAEFYSVSMAS